MTSASDLRDRVTFEARVTTDDGYGGAIGGWEQKFPAVAARIWPRLGGEAVIAARLASRQPVTITVRRSSQTRLIAPDWKATNARNGVEYAIRSIVDPDEHNSNHGRFLDILCEAGTGIAP